MFSHSFTALTHSGRSPYFIRISSLLTAAFLLGASAQTSLATTTPEQDEGIYKRITVSSFEACQAHCSSDRICRGSRADQPDTRYPVMHCKLYDGTGSFSPFPNIAPAPLDLNQALSDLNAYRAQHGLNPVRLNPVLSQASQVHANDLAVHDNISHSGSDGSTHAQRVQRLGYSFSLVAENVATGQNSWPEVFKAWQDSPGHNVNLLQKEAVEFGVAIQYDPSTGYQTFWAMLMAKPLPS